MRFKGPGSPWLGWASRSMGCLGASPPTPDGVSCPDIVRGPSVDQIKGWKLDGGLYPAGEVVCSDTAGTGRRHAGKSTLLTWTTPAAAALRNRNQRTGLAFTLPLTAPSVQFPDRRRWGAQGDERGRGGRTLRGSLPAGLCVPLIILPTSSRRVSAKKQRAGVYPDAHCIRTGARILQSQLLSAPWENLAAPAGGGLYPGSPLQLTSFSSVHHIM